MTLGQGQPDISSSTSSPVHCDAAEFKSLSVASVDDATGSASELRESSCRDPLIHALSQLQLSSPSTHAAPLGDINPDKIMLLCEIEAEDYGQSCVCGPATQKHQRKEQPAKEAIFGAIAADRAMRPTDEACATASSSTDDEEINVITSHDLQVQPQDEQGNDQEERSSCDDETDEDSSQGSIEQLTQSCLSPSRKLSSSQADDIASPGGTKKPSNKQWATSGDGNDYSTEFSPGSRCQVELTSPIGQTSLHFGIVQELGAAGDLIKVFVESLGEKHMVEYRALRPLPPEYKFRNGWRMEPKRKYFPQHLQHQSHRRRKDQLGRAFHIPPRFDDRASTMAMLTSQYAGCCVVSNSALSPLDRQFLGGKKGSRKSYRLQKHQRQRPSKLCSESWTQNPENVQKVSTGYSSSQVVQGISRGQNSPSMNVENSGQEESACSLSGTTSCSVELSPQDQQQHSQQPQLSMQQGNSATACRFVPPPTLFPFRPYLHLPTIDQRDGPINFAASLSLNLTGSDLPDIQTLRFFYNLGCEYYRNYNAYQSQQSMAMPGLQHSPVGAVGTVIANEESTNGLGNNGISQLPPSIVYYNGHSGSGMPHTSTFAPNSQQQQQQQQTVIYTAMPSGNSSTPTTQPHLMQQQNLMPHQPLQQQQVVPTQVTQYAAYPYSYQNGVFPQSGCYQTTPAAYLSTQQNC